MLNSPMSADLLDAEARIGRKCFLPLSLTRRKRGGLGSRVKAVFKDLLADLRRHLRINRGLICHELFDGVGLGYRFHK